MWCVGSLTEEYRQRMYDLLDLYARPFQSREPVVCLDEKSKQLLKDSRRPCPSSLERPCDWITSTFSAVHATCSWRSRTVEITDHRAKTDFVAFVQYLLEQVYTKARRIHLVLDNLNTHFHKCFKEVLGIRAANKLLRRVVFHYTPKHASWLSMAEIEIGILDRQCLDRRLPDRDTLTSEVNAWQRHRNNEQRCIEWTFSRQDADPKMAQHYVS